MTDNELCMVEQLCYISPDLVNAATGRDYSGAELTKLMASCKGKTVGEILDKLGLTDEAIANLENLQKTNPKREIDGACSEPGEWASILRYLRNSDLSDLKLTATMPRPDGKATLAMCFEQPGTPGAIVAFTGTSGGEEWKDDVEGLNVTETECQTEALKFVESLPYDDLTVIGHSKGGNKAMYVTILSDKVTKCISFDGQGFSQEFLEKYWAEIQLRGGKIWNYSVSTDYVHPLLFQIPNSEQRYCQGFGIKNAKQHHSPNSFFKTDKNGNLLLDPNGKPIVISDLKEDPSITMIHEFTAFIINNAPDGEKEALVAYLAPLLAMAMDADQSKLIDTILEDPDTLAVVAAYLVKYMDEYDLSSEDVNLLMKALGLDALGEPWMLLIDTVKDQLNDNNDDWFIANVLLPGLKKLFADDIDIDVTEFWNRINSKVKEIDTSGGKGDYSCRTGEIRDYSLRVYDTLMNAIRRFDSLGDTSIGRWKSYSAESWYTQLRVSALAKAVSSYFEKMAETNRDCKRKIERAFDDVNQIDRTYRDSLRGCVTELQITRSKINAMAHSLK